MPGVREFFETQGGRVVASVGVVLALGACAYAVYSSVGGASSVTAANSRTFIDARSGQTFAYELKVGDKLPVNSPTGHAGYPAEECYWTKEGKTKTMPTYVLLNAAVGKSGPTFCPDCGRLVVGHNSPPSGPNAKAPPTKDEYVARHSAATPDIGRDPQ